MHVRPTTSQKLYKSFGGDENPYIKARTCT